jgi:hypothetical protein
LSGNGVPLRGISIQYIDTKSSMETKFDFA